MGLWSYGPRLGIAPGVIARTILNPRGSRKSPPRESKQQRDERKLGSFASRKRKGGREAPFEIVRRGRRQPAICSASTVSPVSLTAAKPPSASNVSGSPPLVA